MNNDVTVRLAVPEDIDAIMELAIMGANENAFLPPNPLRLLEEIYPAVCRDHGLVGIVTSDPSRIEGVVILRIGKMWYSDQEVLEEKAIFIHPDFRSAKVGRARRLCEFSKSVSDKLGIPLLIGVLSSQRSEGKVRLYRRQFGEPTGAFFLYGAKTGGWNLDGPPILEE